MAKKRFLMEKDVQVWPITRADCVYHISGNELLSTVVDRIAANLVAEANRAKAAEKANADAIADEAAAARAAEQALGARIDAIFAAYDGDQEYTDLAPLA